MIEMMPFIGAGSLVVVAFVVYQKYRTPVAKSPFEIDDPKIPVDRQPSIVYLGKQSEGYQGKVIGRYICRNNLTLRIKDDISNQVLEIKSTDFNKHFQILPHTDITGGKVHLGCRIDANNMIQEWDTGRVNKFLGDFSEIKKQNIVNEDRNKLREGAEFLSEAGSREKSRTIITAAESQVPREEI